MGFAGRDGCAWRWRRARWLNGADRCEVEGHARHGSRTPSSFPRRHPPGDGQMASGFGGGARCMSEWGAPGSSSGGQLVGALQHSVQY